MNLFFLKPIIGGDWSYYFLEYLKELSLPQIWNPHWPTTGLGGNQLPILPLKLYLQVPIMVFVNFLGLPWEIIQKIFWFWGPFLLAIFSSYQLTNSLLGSLIFITNTWILMIVTGGQMGIALSYSIAPLVLAKFIDLINLSTFNHVGNWKLLKKSLIVGLILGVQLMWDVRITYITLIAVGLYFVFQQLFTKQNFKIVLKNLFFLLGLPLLLTVGLHTFWILPMIVTGLPAIRELSGVFSPEAVKFFSFADFSHAFSFLHPNWPENIFGKTYFLQPEFLVLPILAFSSLFFFEKSKIKNQKYSNNLMVGQSSNETILFFVLLGLLGAFLAKGANPPFGEVYLWLFKNFPGMNMFRDPTKFYLLVSLSYIILIPFSLGQISKQLKKVANIKYLVLGIFVIYWLFLIRPTWLGQLGGTFKQREVPEVYAELKIFLADQPEFFRTFWVPQQQRFTFYNSSHPAISAESFFKVASASAIIEKLKNQEAKKLLSETSVKYVIIPYDSEGEIFLEDRKYSSQLRKTVEDELDRITWLKKIPVAPNVAVYEIPNPRDHFWSPSTTLRINYQTINPTEYKVEVKNVKGGDLLVFSEGFDKNWQAKTVSGVKHYVSSSKYGGLLNSFVLPKSGDYSLEVYYIPQRWVNVGLIISAVTLIISVFLLLKNLKRNAKI